MSVAGGLLVPFPKSRKFVSPKRRAANRANAARSTGPALPAVQKERVEEALNWPSAP
jgi:hypothetical protein